MKRTKQTLLILALLIFGFAPVYSQSKIEQYCEMTAIAKFLSKKVTIDVDHGEQRKLFSFKDNRIKDDLGKVKSFNSVVDALNYLGQLGWSLVNAFPVTEGSQLVYHYVFKRDFDKSELIENK
jgi:hypothetical protein